MRFEWLPVYTRQQQMVSLHKAMEELRHFADILPWKACEDIKPSSEATTKKMFGDLKWHWRNYCYAAMRLKKVSAAVLCQKLSTLLPPVIFVALRAIFRHVAFKAIICFVPCALLLSAAF